jgi:multicomponent Na+:H+ antiporter subunit A
MWAGPLALGATGLVFGIIPAWVGEVLVEPAVTAIHPTTGDIQLKLWHGFNLPLLLSVATLTLGAVFFVAEERVRRFEARLGDLTPVNLDRIYDGALAALARLAGGLTRRVQSGSLHAYLAIVFVTFLAIVGAALLRAPLGPVLPPPGGLDGIGIMLALAMTAAVLVAVRTASRLLAVSSLGVVGAGAALFFLAGGAPDVALTQLLVETLTLVLVALVLLRLPQLRPADVRPVRRRAGDALLAGALGVGVTALLLAVSRGPLDRSLTAYFERHSLEAAFGRNIVNVILVDFRGFDTLGEITVVALAGLAGLVLIRGRRP